MAVAGAEDQSKQLAKVRNTLMPGKPGSFQQKGQVTLVKKNCRYPKAITEYVIDVLDERLEDNPRYRAIRDKIDDMLDHLRQGMDDKAFNDINELKDEIGTLVCVILELVSPFVDVNPPLSPELR